MSSDESLGSILITTIMHPSEIALGLFMGLSEIVWLIVLPFGALMLTFSSFE